MNKIKVGLFALTASAVGLFAFRAPDSSNVKPFGVFNYSDTSHRDSTHHKDKWKKKDGHKKDTTAMLSSGDSSMTLALNDSLKNDSSSMLALNNIADTVKKDTAKKDTSKKVVALAMLRANDSSAVAKTFTDSNAVRVDSMTFAFSQAGDSLQISQRDSIVALTKNDSTSFMAYNVRLLQGFSAPARAEVRGIYS